MLITYFSESGRPPVLHLFTARPRTQSYQGYWFAPAAAAPLRIAYEQRVAQVGRLAVRPARQIVKPIPVAGQPQPASAEELTRDLAGWGLPQAAPLGRTSATWLW